MHLDRTKEIFQIKILDSDLSWNCIAGSTVADSADLSGLGKLFRGCHGGGCGVCKIKVHQGEITRKKESSIHITESDKSLNIALACCAKPQSNLMIEIL